MCLCRRGGRSLAASQSLEGWGLRSRNVSGGTQAWKKAGYPVE
jgi:rhodanese-related sulfurtransferase